MDLNIMNEEDKTMTIKVNATLQKPSDYHGANAGYIRLDVKKTITLNKDHFSILSHMSDNGGNYLSVSKYIPDFTMAIKELIDMSVIEILNDEDKTGCLDYTLTDLGLKIVNEINSFQKVVDTGSFI